MSQDKYSTVVARLIKASAMGASLSAALASPAAAHISPADAKDNLTVAARIAIFRAEAALAASALNTEVSDGVANAHDKADPHDKAEPYDKVTHTNTFNKADTPA